MVQKKVRYITKLEKIPELSANEKKVLKEVEDKFSFRTNTYYQSLINWDDPNDPIRRIIMPSMEELDAWGELDASGEHKYTRAPGLEHKYEYTALLLVNNVCGGYCRFCFRKRLFMEENDEVTNDLTEAIEYIRNNKNINNVLMTGGDPLLLSTRKLEGIIKQLREIEHVQIIRIGSKMLAFNPYRVLEDPTVLEMLSKYSTPEKRIYLVVHFNHPRELTPQAIEALDKVIKAGIIPVNQTPLLRGVNDNPEVLAELMNKLSYIGVPPYYVFQCRPTLGNKMFSVPIEEGLEIFEQARMKCSGLAKRARYAMSHVTGKIEILGMTDELIYFRYHRSANPDEKGKFMAFRRNPEAHWFDDYVEMVEEFDFENPFYSILFDNTKGA
ncbi:MAG: KamA family radical SAM protein [Calditrichia bacterium]